jgi:DNA-binding transcriptional ArsR family regulator
MVYGEGMTDPQQDRQVTDPADLKAVAHPLRVRMLALLRRHGPATATELAQQLDTESGSTSYHLRILARHGFVAEAAADPQRRRHPRERRWAAVHRTTGWSNTQLAATDAGREAAAMMRRRQVEVLIGDVERFEAELDRLSPAWVEAAGIGDLQVRLTEASLTALWDRFYAHLDELRARDAEDPAAAVVSVVVAGFPRVDAP